MWVRFLKSKDDACSELETILLDIKHLHTRHHSHSGAFAPVIKFDSDSVLEAAITRRKETHDVRKSRRRGPVLCPIRPSHARQSRTSLAHYPGQCVGDAPQYGRSQLHVVSTVSTAVYLCNRTYNRSFGPNVGIPLTLLTSFVPDASTFRVFGCTVFAKVPTNCVENSVRRRFVASWSATH
jgi:hypothetical protein